MSNPQSTPDSNTHNKLNENLGKSLKAESYEIQKLSENEFCYDIWTYRQGRQGPELKGVYRNGVLEILIANGFRRIYRDKNPFYIREVQNIAEEIKKTQILDFITNYIFTDSLDLSFEYNGRVITEKRENLKTAFLNQAHLIFNDTFLNHLTVSNKIQLNDTANNCYLCFTNGILKISKDQIEVLDYKSLQDRFVWKEHIINFDFQYDDDNENAEFAKFIRNISNQNAVRVNGFKSGLGYLIHNYNDPTKGKAVICYDEAITEFNTPMGGNGKGILAKAVREVRRLVKIDGKKFSSSDKFAFQEVKRTTQVIQIDDVKADFDFDRLNSALTDGINIERKYEHAYTISGDQAPKIIITSNIILDNEGTTRKRRQFILELGSFYSKHIKDGTEEPIMIEHASRFFSKEWSNIEWNRFYSYLIDSVKFFLLKGLLQPPLISVSQNKFIQQTSLEYSDWINAKGLLLGTSYLTSDLFREFKQLYYPDDETYKQRKFSEWLKKYATAKKQRIEFKTINGKNYFALYEI